MIAMLQAELYLIFRQKRTYFGLAAILVIEFFIVIGSWLQGNEIIEILLDNLSKNFYLLGNLLNGHLVLYLVLNSLWFNLPLIIMIIVSGFITNDYKDRIVQTVMLQAVKKSDYVLVKYLAAIIFTLIVLVFLVLTASVMAYTIFGKGDLITYLDGLNFFESDQALFRIYMAFLSGAFLMIFYSVLSISLGILLKEITITWIICALFLILSNLLLKVEFGGMGVWFFPKLIDTWQYFFYYEIPWKDVYLNHLFLTGYIVIVMLGGILLFLKRDIG